MFPPYKVQLRRDYFCIGYLTVKLSAVERCLLENNPTFWENLLMLFEKEIQADFEARANQVTIVQAFEHINQTTVKGLERQLAIFTKIPMDRSASDSILTIFHR